MDSLSSLAAFTQAAELLSFTAAGQKLGISPSAVGKAVSRLEERLGVQLLNRSTRSIALTVEGEALLHRCQRIFAEVQAAEAEIAESSAAPLGRLRISLPLVGTLLTPALAAFSRAFPGIELELDYTDRLVSIIEDGFDVVLRTGEAVDSGLMTKRLGRFSYLIVGSPGYLEDRGIPVHPDDLAAHACLRHRWTVSGKLETWRFRRDDDVFAIEPPPTVVANAIEPLIAMAERGAGLAYLPSFGVARQLADGTLRPVLGPFLQDVGSFRMIWPAGRNQSPKLRAFVDFMTRHAFPDLVQG